MAKRLSGAPARCKDPAVGTATGYRHHIEKRRINKKHRPCLACRAAITAHHEWYKKRRILNGAKVDPGSGYRLRGGEFWQDSTGTRRRLQALGVMGYGWETLGAELGISGNSLGTIARRETVKLYPETVVKIKKLYDKLSMVPPVETRGVKVTKMRLRRRGWPPPLAWDDDTMDDPYVLPMGLSDQAVWDWYCKAATDCERIEWVLEHGIPQPPK